MHQSVYSFFAPCVRMALTTDNPDPDKTCDRVAFQSWWATLPNAPLGTTGADSFEYENRVARNSGDTFFSLHGKRIPVPGARLAINAAYDTVDPDGATRSCRLVDAKFEGAGLYSKNLNFINDPELELFRRYKYALNMYNVISALEIRTNTAGAKSVFENLLTQAGFSLNSNAFVEIYP